MLVLIQIKLFKLTSSNEVHEWINCCGLSRCSTTSEATTQSNFNESNSAMSSTGESKYWRFSNSGSSFL